MAKEYAPATDMSDQKGKVYLVTGGNSGIGKETCRVLLSKNATVWMAARTESKANEAIAELKKSTGKTDLHFLQLDLGNIASIKASAEEFKSKSSLLDVLINNAGVMVPPGGSKTSDGYELQWGTNVLGHFVLTQSLLPLLVATSKARSVNGSVRVINVSSAAEAMAPSQGVDFTRLAHDVGTSSGYFGRWKDYGRSKLGNILLTNELNKRYGPDGVLSFALHPGLIKSNLHQHNASISHRVFDAFSSQVDKGALSSLYTATSPELTAADVGTFFVPWAKKSKASHAKAKDEVLGNEVWEWCEKASAGGNF